MAGIQTVVFQYVDVPVRIKMITHGVLKISGHQQSMVPAPSRGHPHTTSSDGGR